MFRPKHFTTAVLASSLFFVANAAYADLVIGSNTTNSYDTLTQGNITINTGFKLNIDSTKTLPAVTLNSDKTLTLQSTSTVEASLGATKEAVLISGTNSKSSISNSGTIETKTTTVGATKIALNILSSFSIINNQKNMLAITDNASTAISIKATSGSLSGSIINFPFATITGIKSAINIENTYDGSVGNAGTISTAAGGTGNAIDILGTVTKDIGNNVIGTIQSVGGSAIFFGPLGNATINNNGKIQSTVSSSLPAIKVTGTNSIINNGTTGIIQSLKSGTAPAIEYSTIGSSISSLSNTGQILGANNGIDVLTTINGSITNKNIIKGGQVGGQGVGISVVAPITGGILNTATGTITGVGVSVSPAIDVSSAASITNQGTLTTNRDIAVRLNAGSSGVLNNSGTISNTVNISGAASVQVNGPVTYDIINSGNFASVRNGIVVQSGTMTGKIVNSGTIVVPRTPIFITDRVTGGIENSGTLEATTSGINAIVIQESASAADVVNSGTIKSDLAAIFISHGPSNVTNTANGKILGASPNGTGLVYQNENKVVNSINNAGLLEGTGAGSAMELARVVNGTATNTGIIRNLTGQAILLSEAFDAAGAVSLGYAGGLSGGLVNSGTILGMDAIKPAFDFGLLNITNLAGGIIQSNSSTGAAINVSKALTSKINNNGTISNTSSAGNAILVDAILTGSIFNDSNGLIQVSNGADAILVNVNIAGYGITNKGTINAGAAGNAIKIKNSISTDVLNSGTLIGNVALGNSANFYINEGSVISGNITSNNLTTVTFNTGATLFTSGGTIDAVPTINFNGGTVNWNHTINAGTPGSLLSLTNGTLNLGGNTSVSFLNNTGGTLGLSKSVQLWGSYTQSSGSLQITINDKNNYGQLKISEDLSLAGGSTLEVVASPSALGAVTDGDFYDVVTVAGKVLKESSTFKATTSALISFKKTMAPNGKDIRVIASRLPLSSVVTSSELAAISSIFDSVLNAPNVSPAFQSFYNQLAAMSSPAQVNDALRSLVSDLTAILILISHHKSNAANANIYDHNSDRIMVKIHDNEESGYNAGSLENISTKNGMWGQAFGVKANQRVRKGNPGYAADTFGGVIGFDSQTTDNMNLGLAASYAYTDSDTKNGARNNTKTKTYQINAYGAYVVGDNFIDALVSLARVDFETARNIAAGVIQYRALGEYSGLQSGARLGFNAVTKSAGLNIIHSVFLSYSHVIQNAYTERNADALSLRVQKQTSDSLNLGAGIRVDYPIKTEEGYFIPKFDINVSQDLIGKTPASVSSFVGGGAAFRVIGAPIARTTLDMGSGFTMALKDNLSFIADYNIAFKKNYTAQTGSLTVRFTF